MMQIVFSNKLKNVEKMFGKTFFKKISIHEHPIFVEKCLLKNG